ncbi:mesotocin receptor-like [Saccostrea echinata]|uniref:mesotocin receptor-like n=1 Tax=Saccostrea echinata TaxID=191078 RepID=UPI002A7FDC58|nr:mesotocin receptor-like [Saccostrea echinata]
MDEFVYYYDYYDGNQTGNKTHMPYEYPYIIVVFEVSLLFFILAGNITVFVVIVVEGQRSRMHFFIKNLAIADMLCGVFYLIPRIVLHFNHGLFYGGDALCKLQVFLSNIGIYGSNTIMIALSIDRLYILLRPLGSLENRERSPTVICCLCWLIATVVSVSGPIVFEYDEYFQACDLKLTLREIQIYFTIIFIFVFVIPTIIIVGCYSTIAIIIWRVSSKTEDVELQGISSTIKHESELLTSKQHTDSSGISNAKLKTIKMTFVIALAFVCCWAPFMIFNLLSVYDKVPAMEPGSLFIQGLLPLNSVVNPLIYGVFSVRVFQDCWGKFTSRLQNG